MKLQKFETKIYEVRGHKVMLDFMFELSKKE